MIIQTDAIGQRGAKTYLKTIKEALQDKRHYPCVQGFVRMGAGLVHPER